MKVRVFLGGTAGNNAWRNEFIEDLIRRGVEREWIFNPILPPGTWTQADAQRENAAKAWCPILLYYIGCPYEEDNPLSAYSMVEATVGLCFDPDRTVIVFDSSGMHKRHQTAMAQVERELRERFPDGHIFPSLEDAAKFIAENIN